MSTAGRQGHETGLRPIIYDVDPPLRRPPSPPPPSLPTTNGQARSAPLQRRVSTRLPPTSISGTTNSKGLETQTRFARTVKTTNADF